MNAPNHTRSPRPLLASAVATSLLVLIAGTTHASARSSHDAGPGASEKDSPQPTRRIRVRSGSIKRVHAPVRFRAQPHSNQGERSGPKRLGRPDPNQAHSKQSDRQAPAVFADDELARRWFTPIPGVRELSGRLIAMPVAALDGADADQALGQSLAHAQARLAPMRVRSIADTGMTVIRTPRGQTELDLARELMATGDYAFVVPDWRVSPTASDPVDSDDPQRPRQWHLDRIDITDAWAVSTGSAPITIAFVDTGVDIDHPDLAPLLVPGYNSADRRTEAQGGQVDDINGHGTSVAGTAAAHGNNSMGVTGIGWNLRIMPVRTTNSAGGGAFYSDILDGIAWATNHGADIISVSYAGVETPANEALGQAVMNNGGLLVWAAGNMGAEGSYDHPHVIVVSGTQNDDTLLPVSNFGPGIDLAAPAKAIRSTRRGGEYGTFSGTSYASPIVAGVAALVWSTQPELTPAQVRSRLFASAIDIGDPGEDIYFGHGLINAAGALADSPPPPPPPPDPIVQGDRSGSINADCPADLTASANASDPGYGTPDGVVDGSDYAYFLTQFTAGNLAVADIASSSDASNTPSGAGPDGKIDSADFFAYLDRFTHGCSQMVVTDAQ